jgi:hypothetical protein
VTQELLYGIAVERVFTFDTFHVFSAAFLFECVAASRLDTMVQLPISKRSAVHLSIIVVSFRKRAAIATLFYHSCAALSIHLPSVPDV